MTLPLGRRPACAHTNTISPLSILLDYYSSDNLNHVVRTDKLHVCLRARVRIHVTTIIKPRLDSAAARVVRTNNRFLSLRILQFITLADTCVFYKLSALAKCKRARSYERGSSSSGTTHIRMIVCRSSL